MQTPSSGEGSSGSLCDISNAMPRDNTNEELKWLDSIRPTAGGAILL